MAYRARLLKARREKKRLGRLCRQRERRLSRVKQGRARTIRAKKEERAWSGKSWESVPTAPKRRGTKRDHRRETTTSCWDADGQSCILLLERAMRRCSVLGGLAPKGVSLPRTEPIWSKDAQRDKRGRLFTKHERAKRGPPRTTLGKAHFRAYSGSETNGD